VVDDARVQDLLSNPALTTAEQAERFVDLCADELGDSRKRFVHVLAENRRLGLAAADRGTVRGTQGAAGAIR
jgi:F-type H+-transporting ATPase subunit delta